jgi:probable F420-dependent oxidoreductase
MKLTGLGVWTAQFDFHPASAVRDAVQELEALGYTSIWIGENVGREPISQAAILLGTTQRIVVATGVASIWARDPLSALAAQYTLSETHPERFILGLGVSHTNLVDGIRGLRYDAPVETMTEYLAAMDRLHTRYRAVRPLNTTRVIGALGPRMLGVAAALADGAHTYLVPPEHTVTARQILGPGKLLVPEQAVVLETDKASAFDVGRRHIRRYLPLRNYTRNLARLGYSEADFAHHGSDRLIDALVAWGDESMIANRIKSHLQAGADQVCIQVLGSDFRDLPLAQWRRLADLITR